MKNTTKVILFLIAVFLVVIIITLVLSTSTTPTVTKVPSPGSYTLSDVAKHTTPDDCWTTINGNVYDLTPFINSHPGGVPIIMQICGIDGTSAFNNQHGQQKKPADELVSLKIGILSK